MKLLKGLMKLALALLAGAIWLAAAPSPAHATCQLSNGIEHVVYVEFDNVHFTGDNPNVPSDLEQMPHLLNFITQNGTLDAGDHAVLISHTATDILTTQTGLYSDDDGIAVANASAYSDQEWACPKSGGGKSKRSPSKHDYVREYESRRTNSTGGHAGFIFS